MSNCLSFYLCLNLIAIYCYNHLLSNLVSLVPKRTHKLKMVFHWSVNVEDTKLQDILKFSLGISLNYIYKKKKKFMLTENKLQHSRIRQILLLQCSFQIVSIISQSFLFFYFYSFAVSQS